MKFPSSTRLTLLAAAALLPAAMPLPGQAADANPANPATPATLTTVSVTAKGYAADDLETPLATTTLDRAELLRRGAANPGEALRGEPGLAVASDGPQGQNPVIRGLKKESVVLLVDGMRLNSAQPQGAIASFMSAGLAERIEVVKGPASVLYGTGALGGAINVLLPQARFAVGIGFDASAGFDSASSGTRGSGVMNASQGDHALMLGASVARSGDYRSPTGDVAKSGYDSDSVIGQYRFRIDGAQQLRLSLQQHTDKDVWYPGSAKTGTPAALGTVTVHSPKQERSLAEIAYTQKGGGGDANAPLNFEVRGWRQEARRMIQSYSSTLGRNNAETDVRFTSHGADARADWLAHPAHLLSFGIDAWRMEASPQRTLENNAPLFNNHVRNDPFKDGRIDAIGLYVQDDMRFGALNLLAGLRRDTVKGGAASMNNGATTAGLDRSDSAASGSFGAIWQVTPLLRPYANLSRAFRAGEMRERYESSPRGDGYHYLGNPQIKPEVATQFELGLKGATDTLDYRVAAYRNRIADYITGQVTGAVVGGLPVKQTVNLGRVTLTGLEAQGRWQVTRGHWLNVGYSRVRGENNDLNEPLFQMPADELSFGWEGALTQGWTADAALAGDMKRVASEARKVGMADVKNIPPEIRGPLMGKLPIAFRKLGFSVHEGMDVIALDAESLGDRDHTLKQLAELMNKCIACHAAYTVLPPGDGS